MEGFLIAVAAERLVFILFTQKHPLFVMHQSMAHVSQGSAFHADCMNLGHFVCNGAEGRDWSEGNALEVHVETGNDHTDATVGKLVAYIYQAIV